MASKTDDGSCDSRFQQSELSRSTHTYKFDGEGFEAVGGDQAQKRRALEPVRGYSGFAGVRK